MTDFTHLDHMGNVRMVDISEKTASERTAIAQAVLSMKKDTFGKIFRGEIKKGNVLETARIAGIMAAKKTSELIPMCHPLNIQYAGIDFYPDENTHSIRIESRVKIYHTTGVEMEALAAVTIAALTIYDMCKSADRSMSISDISLLEKTGGKSSTFIKRECSEEGEKKHC